MSQYTLSTSWQPLTETSGVLQNVSLVSIFYETGTSEPTSTTNSLIIRPNEKYRFAVDDGETAYIKALNVYASDPAPYATVTKVGDGDSSGSSSDRSSRCGCCCGSTIPEWDIYTGYTKGTLVTYNNQLYRCYATHDSTDTFDLSKWTLIGGGSNSGVAPWSPGTGYVVNDIVRVGSALYVCTTAHTSSSTFSSDADNWLQVSDTSDTNILDWASNEVYEKDEVVVYNGCIYRSNNTHTSGTTFDSTQWELLDDIPYWTANTTYAVGDMVIKDSMLYKCLTANNDATFTASNWEQIGSKKQITDWVASTTYAVGDYAYYDGVLYRCTTANTDTTFNVANWQAIGADQITDWGTSTSYQAGDYVYYQQELWRCTTNHTSDATDFYNDMKWGFEKWVKIGDRGGAGSNGYSQVYKANAAVGDVIDIPIQYTTTFCKPPVEILKYEEGSTSTENKYTFSNDDATKFTVNGESAKVVAVGGTLGFEQTEFDNTAHEITDYTFAMSEEESVADTDDDGNAITRCISITDSYINLDDYANVEKVGV